MRSFSTPDPGEGSLVGMVAPGSDVLDIASRAGALRQLAAADSDNPLDLLVVGGGVVGCGSALDAASRGLTVGLVERRDLASGTSSRSSRLAHGGLRYLEQREFSLVHEALTERGLLLDRLAPHLVRPVPFLYPVTRRGWERPYVGFGITVYDMLSRFGAYGGAMQRPRTLSAKAVQGIAPGLRADAHVGAVRFNDAQIDDARHTVAVARTAAAHGTAIATRTAVIGLLREDDRIVGALLRDELTGEHFPTRARVVLGAAGVWTDDLVKMAGVESSLTVRQSKGIHLVVPKDAFLSNSALIARTPTSVLFLLPWGEYWLVGTTDTDYEGPRDEPRVDEADVDYLLAEANKWLARPLSRQDIVGIYSGLRPLLSAGDGEDGTATLSREHAVLHPAPGLVAVAGGKYTTYRVMAADAVDEAIAERAELVSDPVPDSQTDEIPLVGGAGYAAAWAARERTARAAGLPLATIEHLLRRQGDRVQTVLDLVASNPELAAPMHPDTPYIMAEAVLAVTREGALSLEDILVRRTRLALETPNAGIDVAEKVATIVAPYLGWDQGRIEQEVVRVAQRREALQPVPGGSAVQEQLVEPAELADSATDEADVMLVPDADLPASLPHPGSTA